MVVAYLFVFRTGNALLKTSSIVLLSKIYEINCIPSSLGSQLQEGSLSFCNYFAVLRAGSILQGIDSLRIELNSSLLKFINDMLGDRVLKSNV
jgi:hypothetical protein